MRIPDKPGQNRNIVDSREGLLKKFAKSAIHGNMVLLIGQETLLRIPTEEEASEDKNLKILRECNGSMDKWIDSLQQRFFDKSDSSDIKKFLIRLFEENGTYPQLEPSEMNPEILKLIESKVFRLVLTTTFDPLVEEAMEKAWGGKEAIDVRNFGDDENWDLGSLDKLVATDDLKPTLYYLFGKATNNVSNYGNPKFVVDEEDYIKAITKWMAQPSTNLKTFMANKGILAVGCKFDHWLFRFFWRAVLEAKKTEEENKHLLAIRLTSSEDDLKLRDIIHYYRLKCPEDVNEFLIGLNHAIEDLKKKAFEVERQSGGIFLSYCSKDFDRVLNLFYRLRDSGFKVWMDWADLKAGESYVASIKEAIEKASVFIPVLSRTIATHKAAGDSFDTKDPDYHFYRDFEWNYAVLKSKNAENEKENNLEIVPFALEDYNPRKVKIPIEVENAYPEIFEKHLVSYNNAGFSLFLSKISKILKS